jgi:hypothetical protein
MLSGLKTIGCLTREMNLPITKWIGLAWSLRHLIAGRISIFLSLVSESAALSIRKKIGIIIYEN